MKKTGLLNAPVSGIVAQLAHGNSLCISDAGLPVPSNVDKIDLAISEGIPSFLEVFSAVTSELFIERIVIAKELEQQTEMHKQLRDQINALQEQQTGNIEIETVSHDEFKNKTSECHAIVRTGEYTPFANVIIYSGVPF